MKYVLNWYGSVNGQSGYENITRGILFALDKLGVKVSLKSLDSWSKENVLLPSDETYRLERMLKAPMYNGAPMIVQQVYQPDIPDGCGDIYIYSLFETDRIPEEWIEGFKKAKGVFTFSSFNCEHWGKALDNVHHLGFGMNKTFLNGAKGTNILNKRGYTFLSVGDYTERKGFDILLDAYCEEFKANEDVTLILKTHKGGFVSYHKEHLVNELKGYLAEKYPNHPNILLYMDKVQHDDLSKLYKACDCFVLATRGEGLGLPVAEAMAAGLPVITTAWGGHMDFVKNGQNAVTVPYKIETINDIEYIKKCPHALGHKWAVPDKNWLRQTMRTMFVDRENGKELGNNGRQLMTGYNWKDVAVEMLKVIYENKP